METHQKTFKVKQINVCTDRPGLLFEFKTEAEASQFFNSGLNSDRKEQVDATTIYLRFDLRTDSTEKSYEP